MAKILFIDDDATVLAQAGTALTASGHSATLAIDGRAGVDAYRAQLFELVVTDLFMPDQDGIETIRQIRKISGDTPILAITESHQDATYLRAATALGANGTLNKPFSANQLVDAVDTLLAA
jgi:CheY-like chemotaxis protein